MSTESSNLIRLITSLKQGEKRYITLELSRYKKENNLLKLYQVISNNQGITDATIRKKIKDKKFISQLSIHKHKLYSTILDILQQLHLKSSPYSQTVSMIHQAHLLFNKGLIKAQKEILIKAALLANRYEFRELHLQILNQQQRLQNNDSEETILEIQKLCVLLSGERKLNQLLNRNLIFENEPGQRLNSRQQAELKKLMDAALKIENDSFTANYYRLRVCFSYYAILGDHKPTYNYSQALIKLFKKFPHMLELESWRIEYIESLRNSIPAFIFFGKPELNEFVYNEAKRLDVPDIYKASIAINIMDSYIQNGAFFENEKRINDIQNHLDYYNTYLSSYNKPILYFNLAVLNIGLKKFSKALFWLNEIINNSSNDVISNSLSAMTRIVRLLIFYELGHVDLLENNIRSTQRYLTKHESQFQIDLLLLKFIRKAGNTTDKKEWMSLLKQTKAELVKWSTDPVESRALYFFDFISWIDSKLEQKSFPEMIKKKNEARLKSVK